MCSDGKYSILQNHNYPQFSSLPLTIVDNGKKYANVNAECFYSVRKGTGERKGPLGVPSNIPYRLMT